MSASVRAATRLVVPLALACAPMRALQAQSRPDTVHISLAAAIATALDRAIAIQLADIDRRVGGVGVIEAYSRFLPSLTAGAGLGYQAGSTLLSSTATVATDARIGVGAWQLSASLNLFNGWRDQASVRAALSGRDASELSYVRARQLVAFDVTQAFEQVVLDQQLVSVAQAALVISQAREDQLTEQVRVGNRAPPDLL